MRRPPRFVVFAAAAIASSGLSASPAFAASPTATATGQAGAQVVEPLVVTSVADLGFGVVFASTSTGTVTVSADGALAYSGGAQPTCIAGACDAAHPASFAVTGEPGRTYAVQVPASVTAYGSITGSGQGSAPPLKVDGLNAARSSGASGGAAWQLDGNGRDTFDVGGTLHLPANLPSASYRATIPVVVVYG